MGVTVKRPVRVKAIVTEAFKEHRAAEIRAALTRLDAVAKRVELHLQKVGPNADAVAERLATQERRNQEAKAALTRELGVVSALDLGTEYVRGMLEGTVEVEIGDDFSKLAGCEIVIKDDKIVEIRDGLCLQEIETSS